MYFFRTFILVAMKKKEKNRLSEIVSSLSDRVLHIIFFDLYVKKIINNYCNQ